jgi:hypothetical protein
VICNIANKDLPELPFGCRSAKPNYWFGLREEPTPNNFQETIYATHHYTLASLWSGSGGQITRFQLVARGKDGGIAFTGGHPTDYKYRDGGGKYDQSCQVGGTYICMSRIPEDDPLPYVFFSLPSEDTQPERRGDWLLMQAGRIYIGAISTGR